MTVRRTIAVDARVGDFVIWGHRSIALVRGGQAKHPDANLTGRTQTVSLDTPTIEVVVPDDDTAVLIGRGQVTEIVKAFAWRLKQTNGLSPNDYRAADSLVDGPEQLIEANGLFDDPADPILKLVFDDAVTAVCPEGTPNLDKLARVAYLAIFSEYMED